MALKRQGTKKGGAMTGDMAGDIMLKGAMNGMPIDEYVEKPRPSLFNVVKKLKEARGQMIHRFCYISKIIESEFKGQDVSEELTKWVTDVFNTRGEDEMPRPDEF